MKRIVELINIVKAYSGKKAFGTAIFISIMNQLVSSGTGFAVGIYLIRTLSITEYGLYGICYAISLFYAGIGNSMFLTQMVVHMPDKVPEERQAYAAQIFLAIVIFSGFTLLFVGLIILLGGNILFQDYEYRVLGMTISILSISYIGREFVIKHAYNLQREHWALECNLIILLSLSILLLAIHYFEVDLNAVMALLLFVLPNVAGTIYGLVRANIKYVPNDLKKIKSDFIEIVLHGMWTAKMTIAASLRGQSLTFVAASLLGPLGVAYLNASRLLVSPIQLVFPVINQVIFPRMARLYKENPQSIFSFFILSCLSFLIIVVIYGAIVDLEFEVLSKWLLEDKFDLNQVYTLTILFLFHAIVLSIRNTQELLLQVIRKSKYLAILHGLITAITYVILVTVILNTGLVSGVVVFLASEVVLVTTMCIPLYVLYKKLHKEIEKI